MGAATLHEHVVAYFGRLKGLIDSIPLGMVENIGDILFQAYRHNKQVFVVGNGGSAATASHIACDLSKNTIGPHRPRFRVLSLNDNMPLFSALANDVGYDNVFSEQLVNLVRPGDVLLTLSGSGVSPNVVEAMRYARSRSATVIAFLGFEGGAAAPLADAHITVPSDDYGLIEDVHLMLGHVLTTYFRERLGDEDPPS